MILMPTSTAIMVYLTNNTVVALHFPTFFKLSLNLAHAVGNQSKIGPQREFSLFSNLGTPG